MQFQIQFRAWTGKPALDVEIGAEFESASLGVKLGAAIKVAFKSDAVLRGADLRGADLSDADLRGAVLRGADLSDADLRGAVLRDAYLSGAVLRGAVLRDADLRDAVLRGADLRDADLSDADLSDADLRDADLSGAVLRGAVLSGAVLRGGENVPDFTMPDGLLFSEYLRDVVPALLTAGGKTVADIVASGAWQCHDWSNCPMHIALGIKDTSEAPPLLRARVKEFVQLFDGGLIPEPKVEEGK